jgi:hypothetical protein
MHDRNKGLDKPPVFLCFRANTLAVVDYDGELLLEFLAVDERNRLAECLMQVIWGALWGRHVVAYQADTQQFNLHRLAVRAGYALYAVYLSFESLETFCSRALKRTVRARFSEACSQGRCALELARLTRELYLEAAA